MGNGMIETEHRGYKIIYSENGDVWRCHALDMDGHTLSQLKNKMNRYVAKMAKVGGIPALRCSYGASTFEECEINSVTDTGKVWVSTDRQERWRGEMRTVKERNKVEPERLVLDTPENRALIAESERLRLEYEAARKAWGSAFEAVPRVDVSSLPKGDPDA